MTHPSIEEADPHGVFLSANDQPEPMTDGHSRSQHRGLIVMLHGFDLKNSYDPGAAFRPACDYVRMKLEPEGYAVWAMRYDTLNSFRWAGINCTSALRSSQLPLNNVHIFGYSMGGLVGRTMVAEGIDARTVYTYTTPNEGTGWWVPNLLANLGGDNAGALSMMGQSADLAWLNLQSPEVQKRANLVTIGYRHKGAWGDTHENDGMSELHSQCMQNVCKVKPGLSLMWGWPKAINKHIPWENAFQPHTDAQILPYAQPALDHFIQTVRDRS